MKIYNLVFLLLLIFPFAFDKAKEAPRSMALPGCQQKQETDLRGYKTAKAADIIFKSADGGESWQDISEGLPESLRPEDFQRDGFIANENGLYISAGNEIYHSKSNSTAPFWEKQDFPGKHSSIVAGRSGMFAFNYEGNFLHKDNRTKAWSPVYANVQTATIRSVFETAGSTVFVGSDNGLLRSTNGGKTWKQVYSGGWVIKMVESDGIIIATSQEGIIRSTDDGVSWDWVISEGGVGIAVEIIKDGFAAITYNTDSETRRVRTSYDGGKTWQAIDAGLRGDQRTSSIIQAGEYLFCGHPDGIFRSLDKGKTWKLVRSSIGTQVFNLFVSGNVIYAIPKSGGC